MMWRPYRLLCIFSFFHLHFLPNVSSSSSITHLCPHHEAAALIQFKSSFSIDEGSSRYFYYGAGIKSYPKTNSWKEGTDCCQWDGVTCDIKKGHVIGLDLSCSWLYGTIPSNTSLFLLPHLQKLNLAFNDFNSSKISSKFGELVSLVYLNLSKSSFSGQVPSQLSHLSKLVSLDLSWNYYQTLDKHTLKGFVENLTEVRQLSLDGINLSSINLNVLMNLSASLTSLSLGGCRLRGKFPTNIFNRPNLKFLNLRRNFNLSLNLPKLNWSSHLEHLELSPVFFSKELIDSIGNIQSLKYLLLSYTSFPGGLFPDSFTNLSSLETLIVYEVNFSGGLPNSIGNLVSLKDLELSGTNLSGPIPKSLGNLSQLRYLYLSRNGFSGELPYSLINLRQLEELDISENSVEGSIPDEVTAFPNLIYLDLSSNLLNGTLPSWLYVSTSSLKHISLRQNQLSGHIKEVQSTPIEIDLSYNKLQGPIPPSISQLLNLSNLDLQSNNFSGTFDFGMFSKLHHLYSIQISQNHPSLTCTSTSADYSFPNLQSLILSCNIKEFPQFLKGSKGLLSLDLSNNRISGKIPNWMWDVGNDSLTYLNLSHNSLTNFEQLPWKKIQYLDVSSNLIHGDLPIPPSTTRVFLISNNSLCGGIPSLICNLSSLDVLDLSRNNLSGSIPPCFGNLSKSVSMLNLQKNKFRGIIPPTFVDGCQLRNLNLNANQLEGPLTRSIINCTSLEVLDLGNNKINDTFPYWLESLPELQVVVLRSNQLHGPIYDTRSGSYFSRIQIFDLSSNYFTGLLPARYIRNFKAMINLSEKINGISYMGRYYSGSSRFYSYSISITIKGKEIQLEKIFTLLMSIDLSNNKFEGEIPEVIGKLNSLKGLNLSHNNLSGYIPTSIGNLISLEWLDLSSNKLVGTIPERLVNLTSLSVFNVSENHLGGKIPQGKQFNTFGNDSYEENRGLCGFPVSKGCNNSEAPPSNLVEDDGSKQNIGFGWKAVLAGYGCGIVFGLAMGFVVFQTGKPEWLVSLVEDQHQKKQKRSKLGNGRGTRRRI